MSIVEKPQKSALRRIPPFHKQGRGIPVTIAAAVTNDHPLSDLKQNKLIILQLCSLNGSTRASLDKIQDASRAAFLSRGCSAFLGSWPPFPTSKSATWVKSSSYCITLVSCLSFHFSGPCEHGVQFCGDGDQSTKCSGRRGEATRRPPARSLQTGVKSVNNGPRVCWLSHKARAEARSDELK